MDYRENYKHWLEDDYFDEATREELRGIASDEKEIKEKLIWLTKQKDMVLKEYAERAYKFGMKNHSRQVIYDSFCSTIEDAVR